MLVARLSLSKFRNWTRASFDFTPGLNLIHGPNGQGKTNIVEAIYCLAGFGSHRTGQTAPLIQTNSSFARIQAYLTQDRRSIDVDLKLREEEANQASVGQNLVKYRDLSQVFNCVCFSPEDLGIVRQSPSGRRKFLDELSSFIFPEYRSDILGYTRALSQRNSLLKLLKHESSKSQLDTFEIWTRKLADFGARIIERRIRVIDQLSPALNLAYNQITGIEQKTGIEYLSTPSYQSSDNPFETLYTHLESKFVREKERGITLAGPHCDELVFWLNGLKAKDQASHGEIWSLVLGLRLACGFLLRNRMGLGDPVIILDDVLAELDKDRQRRLAEAISDYQQVFITSTTEDYPLSSVANRLKIQAARVV